MKIQTAILFYMLFAATPLFAREKTDVLIMKNGDRLTCEIKGLNQGVLYVSFDYIAGTSSVDWSKVRHLESKQLFIVRTQDGLLYTGTLSTAETGAARPTHIEVAENAGTNIVVEQQKIMMINQTSERFWQRFNGAINSGLIYSKGNESSQYNLGVQVQYPRERWATGASYNSTLSASTGATVSTRNNGAVYVRRSLRWDNWFYTGVGNFLQSSEQGISLQSNLGAGIGHYLKNTNRSTIAVVGGLAYQNTQYSQTGSQQGTQNTVAALASLDVNIFKFNKTNLAITANAFPSLSQPGRIFANTNATYYLKFFGNFTWNLSFYGNWDNQPPPNFSGSDYGTSTGLGWTFGNK